MTEVAKQLYAETCGCGEHVVVVLETQDGEKFAAPLPLENCVAFANDLLGLVAKSKETGGVLMARKH